MMRKLPKTISYDVCIKNGNIYYVAGRFLVRVYKGELMFIPSPKYIRRDKAKLGEEVDHFIWHSSGQYHIKKKSGLYDTYQPRGTSLPLRETGLQPLFQMYLKNLDGLPKKENTDNLDVVFDAGGTLENLCIEVSLMSGRWLLKNKPELGFGSVMSPNVLAGLITKDMRFLGQHSDNADKIIQFFLAKVEFPDSDPNITMIIMPSAYQNIPR